MHNTCMNRLDNARRSQVIRCLVEGTSVRATVRMTGVAKKTVLRLLCEIGEVCREVQDVMFRGLTCRRIQIDEIWSFCGAKEKIASAEKKAQGWGDVWTWVAIDADTKIVPSWLVGKRDAHCAIEFVNDLAGRLSHRVQVTSDGHRAYLVAIENAFGADVDYAMLIKIYGKSPLDSDTRYSPPECIGIETKIISGDPDGDHISTSFIERQNLTMRMHMRRFTRLTNAFSKKLENHAAAIALHYMHYNFCKIHMSLRITRAMAAGVTDRLWNTEDVVRLLEAKEHARHKDVARLA